MQASEQALRAGHLRPFFWLVTQFSKGIQRSKINMEWNEEVISCVANLSVRFRSPRTGFSVLAARKMNERKRPRSCSIFRPAKTEIPIPRSFFFAPKPQGNLLRRLKKPRPKACKQAPWGRAPKSSPEVYQRNCGRFARWQTKLYSTAYQRCFLIKLDSIAAIAKKGPVIRAILAISIITLYIRDTERLYIIKKLKSTSGLHVHVPQRSQRLLRNFWYIISCEVFTLKSCWSTCAVTVFSRLFLF